MKTSHRSKSPSVDRKRKENKNWREGFRFHSFILGLVFYFFLSFSRQTNVWGISNFPTSQTEIKTLIYPYLKYISFPSEIASLHNFESLIFYLQLKLFGYEESEKENGWWVCEVESDEGEEESRSFSGIYCSLSRSR